MINFLKYNLVYLTISSVVIGLGLFSIVRWGYKYSIDFSGGTNLEYKLSKDIPATNIKSVFNEEKIEVVNLSVQNKILTARTKAIDDKQELQLRTLIEKKFNTNVSVQRSETVGPVIGKESVNKTIIASVLAIIGILLYMSFAFKSFNFALAAIIALLHDFLVVGCCRFRRAPPPRRTTQRSMLLDKRFTQLTCEHSAFFSNRQ
jgi:preprotein translocase subunit SecF